MQAGSVNASVLLASFLGNEHEKIGQEISRSDFAGELRKCCSTTKKDETGDQLVDEESSTPQDSTTTVANELKGLAEGESAVDNTCKTKCAHTQSNRAAEAKARIKNLKATAENGDNIFITNPLLAESILTELHYPSETIKACKNLQNKDGWISIADFKALLASQPAASSTQQAQTQTAAPAQISTSQVQALLSTIVQKVGKDGTSSSGTLKSVQSQSTVSSSSQAGNVSTVADLRSMIDQVLQKANAESTSDKTIVRAPIAPTSAAASAQEIQITGAVMMTPKEGQAQKVAAATVPSFISDDSTDGTDGVDETTTAMQARIKAAATSSVTPVSEASGKDRPAVRTSAAGASDANKPPSEAQLKTGRQNASAAAPGTNGDIPDVNTASDSPGPKSVPNTGVPAADRLAPVQDVASLAESFGAKIVSSGSDDLVSAASEPVSFIGSLEESTLRNLELTSGKTVTTDAAAKQFLSEAPPVDVQGLAPAGRPDLDKTPQAAGEQTGPVEEVPADLTAEGQPLDALKTAAAEGHTEQQSAGYSEEHAQDPSRSYPKQVRTDTGANPASPALNPNADSTLDALPAATTTLPDKEKTLVRDALAGTVPNPARTALPTGTLAPGLDDAPAQNSISPEVHLESGSSSVTNGTAGQAQATENIDTTVKADADVTDKASETDSPSPGAVDAPSPKKKAHGVNQVETQSQGVAAKAEGAGSESSLQKTLPSHASSTASRMVKMPSSTNPAGSANGAEESIAGIQDSDASAAGLVQQEPAPNLSDQITEAQDAVSQSSSQGKSSVHGRNAAMMAKEMETQLKYSDATQNSAVQQGLASGLQDTTRIQMPGMQQSMTDGGFNSYYDPGRSVQIVESYREHLRSIGGQQLTLEMEHSEFGKMNIKVGARKDEVSAAIMTENDSARQALLKNSPELRQDLENQGLELGKFMVDVDRQNSGNQNDQQWQRAQTSSTDLGAKPAASTEQPKSRPSYVNMNGRLSRVSLFA